jgi:hypothetical protein
MPGFWDTITGISGDTSVGDSSEQIQQVEDEAKAAMGETTNDQWGNDSAGGGSNVADSSDHGASMNYSR